MLASIVPKLRPPTDGLHSGLRNLQAAGSLLSRSMRALLFIVRLRRLVEGTLGMPSDSDDESLSATDAIPCPGPVALSSSSKRAVAEQPSSRSSTASSTSSGNSRDALLMPPFPPRPPGGGHGKKQNGERSAPQWLPAEVSV